MATNLSSYDAFYAMLDMIPCSKVLEKSGKKPPELTQQNKVELAEIYDILQLPLNATKQDFDNAYEKALRVIIKVFNNLNISKGTKAIGGNDYNDSKPPEGASSVPEEIKRAIYFVTYLAYVYTFGLSRNKNTIGRAGYQARVLKEIENLSEGTVTFGDNTWTKWGLHPEHDFIEGTYNPEELPYSYMGQKSEDLLFMLKTLADSAYYDTFVDLFGGSGVCSLARSYNPSVQEYINDFDFRNVCFYLAMTEHFKDFKEACLELAKRVEEGKLSQSLYNDGDKAWTDAIRRHCNKWNELKDNMYRAYKNAYLNRDEIVYAKKDKLGGGVDYWNMSGISDTANQVASGYNWNTKFDLSNIAKESKILIQYIENVKNKYPLTQLESAFIVYSGIVEKLNKNLDIRHVSDLQKQKKDKYALGLYRYFERLFKANKNNICAFNQPPTLKPSLKFNMEYAVGFLYMRLCSNKSFSGISYANSDNILKMEDILKELERLQSRFKTLGVFWTDAIAFLNRPNKIEEMLKKIEENPDKEALLTTELITNRNEYQIFTDEECNSLTKKKFGDVLSRAKFTVDYYKNILVYVDSPYIDTTGYIESSNGGFDFDAYRDAIDNFSGKYIYSCRFSSNTSGTSLDLDIATIEQIEKANKKSAKLTDNLKVIYDYYKEFKSIKYVCFCISNYDDIAKAVIKKNPNFKTMSLEEQQELIIKYFIHEYADTAKLEVMFTNFDFNLPISDYQGLFKKDDEKEVDTGKKKKKGAGNNSKKNTFTFDYDKSVREAGETKFYKLDFKTFMGYVEEVFRELKVPIGTTDCGKVVKKK
ncbi:MAG: hypothetical protein IJE43_16045 [Alphaproteobacteria bacterium]|nr:hypothetical protein [Alphaproteobacteria bacterium]